MKTSAQLLWFAVAAAGCYRVLPSRGGGQTPPQRTREARAEDVAVPGGYRVEKVAEGLNMPTAVAWDDEGRLHILEAGYAYGEAFTTARLLRVEPGGARTTLATGDNGPWNGVVFHDGAFYIAEGGMLRGGALVKVTRDGQLTRLAEGFPTNGDHQTNGPAVGPDGKIYLGLGTRTNSGVVGVDNFEYGWLRRHPDAHDIPCRDVTLAGVNYESENPLADPTRRAGVVGGRVAAATTPRARAAERARVLTGAYLPFGTPSTRGQVIEGQVPCSGAVLRFSTEGGEPELVAWGFRNPFGLAFGPEGALYVTDNGYDDRGSRRVWGNADWLWRVEEGRWYGWPDYADGRPIDQARYQSPGHPVPRRLLREEPNPPPKPLAFFGVHASADGFDFSRSPAFGHVGEAFVALFGDMAPETGKVVAPVGFRVVRVDPRTGVQHEFMTNEGRTVGPASKLGGRGLERPLSAKFDPSGRALYVVDFGIMTVGADVGARPQPNTGVVWRVVRGGVR